MIPASLSLVLRLANSLTSWTLFNFHFSQANSPTPRKNNRNSNRWWIRRRFRSRGNRPLVTGNLSFWVQESLCFNCETQNFVSSDLFAYITARSLRSRFWKESFYGVCQKFQLPWPPQSFWMVPNISLIYLNDLSNFPFQQCVPYIFYLI